MTEDQRTEAVDETDGLARLLRAAGRRPEPPPGAYEETLSVLTAAWEAGVRRRRRRRLGYFAGAAAAALASVVVLLPMLRPAPTIIARPDRLVGAVEWIPADGEAWSSLSGTADAGLGPGARLRTGPDGYAGLRLTDGASLRVAPDTELELSAVDEIALVSGRVYVDSGRPALDAGTQLAIVTPVGRAVEVGTQYEVRYQRDDDYRLRVREGLVRLMRRDSVLDSVAGEELIIRADGTVTESSIETAAEAWQWVLTVAPIPAVDSRPVTLLLEWVARETGRQLRFASPELREQAMRTTLHGHIGSLSPLEALRVLLATTDLDYSLLADGTIEVRARTGP